MRSMLATSLLSVRFKCRRARYMPQNPFIVATKSAGTDVYIFDTSKHPSDPGNHKSFSPELRCEI